MHAASTSVIVVSLGTTPDGCFLGNVFMVTQNDFQHDCCEEGNFSLCGMAYGYCFGMLGYCLIEEDCQDVTVTQHLQTEKTATTIEMLRHLFFAQMRLKS